jgi:hypothetical protein
MSKTAAEIREEKASLRIMLSNGKTDFECMEEMNLVSLAALRKLKSGIFADELDDVQGDSAATLYVRQKLKLERCIASLDDIIDDAAANSNAKVSAIKAKMTAIDDIMKLGQDLGVLPKAKSSDDDKPKGDLESIKAKAAKVTEALEKMVLGYGSGDYAKLEDETELYFGMPEDDEDDLDLEDEEDEEDEDILALVKVK